MARIALDPAFDIQPDFSSPTFEGLRVHIIRGTQTTHDEVANELVTAWQQDRDLRVTSLEKANQEHLCLEHEAEAKLREAEKKKPKINDFQTGTAIGNTLTPRPSQYAIHKLKSFKYVELWYFSPDGCKVTADDAKTNTEDTFGLAKVDDFVALKPVAFFKASRKAIQDHNLEWRQFDLAKNSFLLHINKLKWPEKHHKQALLLYAARVCRDWHDTLVLNNAFDISIFNLTLLKNMSEEVWNKVWHESLIEHLTVLPITLLLASNDTITLPLQPLPLPSLPLLSLCFQMPRFLCKCLDLPPDSNLHQLQTVQNQHVSSRDNTSSHRHQTKEGQCRANSRSRFPPRNPAPCPPPQVTSPNHQRPRQDCKCPSQEKQSFQNSAV
ncbi:hypothetical protein EV424DRAFT_1539667 [Suillus variegatus]|nr:hypothetical protein EV424DRAFT_1539667 [Suillus variegatus]